MLNQSSVFEWLSSLLRLILANFLDHSTYKTSSPFLFMTFFIAPWALGAGGFATKCATFAASFANTYTSAANLTWEYIGYGVGLAIYLVMNIFPLLLVNIEYYL